MVPRVGDGDPSFPVHPGLAIGVDGLVIGVDGGRVADGTEGYS